MIVSVDKGSFLNLFGAENFLSLENMLNSMAPSLVEYQLFDFISNFNDEVLFFNKRDIQSSFSIGDYSLYLDYNENIYLENSVNATEDTPSFW